MNFRTNDIYVQDYFVTLLNSWGRFRYCQKSLLIFVLFSYVLRTILEHFISQLNQTFS